MPFTGNGFTIDPFEYTPTLFNNFTLYEVVENCKGKEIEITLDHHNHLCFNDIVLPESDIDFEKFPENPFGDNKLTSSGIINRMDTFKRAFEFISDDETRYFMNGVHFVLADGKLRFEATDGRTGLQSDPTMGKSESGINEDYIVRDITAFVNNSLSFQSIGV